MRKIRLIVLAAIVGIAIIFLVQMKQIPSIAYETSEMTTIVRTNSSHTVGYSGLAQVSCNSGETLTGGGYYSEQWHELLSVYRNGPSDDGKKWQVEMMYVAPHYYGQPPSFTIYAMCSKFSW